MIKLLTLPRATCLRPALAAALALPLALCAPLAAGADQCKIPADMPTPLVVGGKAVNTPVYDLQLVYSWSPHHCAAKDPTIESKPSGAGGKPADDAAHASLKQWDYAFQCQNNRFGFVVHGLWPQGKGLTGSKDQPRACKSSGPLATQVLRQNLCTVPGVGLMQNEWESHGTCHWNTPQEYFSEIRDLAARYPMPSLAKLEGRDVPVRKVVDEIVAGSGGRLKPEMIGVRVENLKGSRSLQEIYICMDLQQQPKECLSRGTPDDLSVVVLPVGGDARAALRRRQH